MNSMLVSCNQNLKSFLKDTEGKRTWKSALSEWCPMAQRTQSSAIQGGVLFCKHKF